MMSTKSLFQTLASTNTLAYFDEKKGFITFTTGVKNYQPPIFLITHAVTNGPG